MRSLSTRSEFSDNDRLRFRDKGDSQLLTPSLLALAAERASDWGLGVGITMILCNILALAIGKFGIQRQDVGPQTPIGGMSVPAVVASTCFGHILGAGTILGLTNLGVL